MAYRIEVDLPSQYSDGSPAKWPTQHDYVWAPADKLYHERLADLGMDLIQGSIPGRKYIYKELPRGYRIYQKQRNKDGRYDRYIFGHPQGRFDSPMKFSKHFKWLMQDGIGICECVNCGSQTLQNTPPSSLTATVNASGSDANDLHAQLERFTKHLVQNCDGRSEYKMTWQGPPPWETFELLDGKNFKDVAARYRTLPSFMPRKGELVLFYLNEESGCRFEESTQYFKMFDSMSGKFRGFPIWRAGVVAAEPEGQLGHEELSRLPSDHLNITSSFRIELYPDPDSRDKSLSDDTHLIRLHRIRPLSLFHEFLSGIPQIDWHESIHHALKSMNTVCPVDPIEFAGRGFSFSIRCRGIWIGPELYVNGDAVRLLPAKGKDDQIDQILVIRRIDWRFESDDIHDERSSIVVAGPVVTINKNRSFQDAPFTFAEKQGLLLPASTAGYDWYPINISSDGHPLGGSHEEFSSDWQEVPISYIVGRLYDVEAMKLLLNIGNFDAGGLGMKQARRWAKKHLTTMIAIGDQEWILLLDRIEALDIEMLNCRPVGNGAKRPSLKGNSTNPPRSKMPNSRNDSDRGLTGRSSSVPSSNDNGTCAAGDFDNQKRQWEKDSETSDAENNALSDSSGHRAQSFKLVVTDRTHNGAQDEEEDENAETFISEVIAGNVLHTEARDLDGGMAAGAQNGEKRGHEHPAKRPRL